MPASPWKTSSANADSQIGKLNPNVPMKPTRTIGQISSGRPGDVAQAFAQLPLGAGPGFDRVQLGGAHQQQAGDRRGEGQSVQQEGPAGADAR